MKRIKILVGLQNVCVLCALFLATVGAPGQEDSLDEISTEEVLEDSGDLVRVRLPGLNYESKQILRLEQRMAEIFEKKLKRLLDERKVGLNQQGLFEILPHPLPHWQRHSTLRDNLPWLIPSP